MNFVIFFSSPVYTNDKDCWKSIAYMKPSTHELHMMGGWQFMYIIPFHLSYEARISPSAACSGVWSPYISPFLPSLALMMLLISCN